jgi:two-component system, OmpR family, response regulator
MTTIFQLKVLVVDDDPDIRTILTTYLSSQGIAVTEAGSETALLADISLSKPDVILLDLNLGTEDELSIARRLRQHWHGGLIMVTGRGDTIDRVVGLEIGADDYIPKPFELRELLARVRSVGRRCVKENAPEAISSPITSVGTNRFTFDRFTLTLDARELRNDQNEIIPLTTGEFNLLTVLVENPGRVLSRDYLLQLTHNRETGPFDRTIDVQIGRLRKKLKDDGTAPRVIKSVRSQGYLFALGVYRQNHT